jgi:small subunit ribosomal protein S15
LSSHKGDNSSRRGLIKKVSKRRKLLKYLAAVNPTAYKKVLQTIKTKKI